MSKQIILITGGARSGKSKYAEDRVLEMGRRRLYLATAEAKDEEMVQRIAAHKKRRGDSWTTIEEPVELAEALLARSEEHTSELQSLTNLVCRLLLEKKK